MTVDAGAPQRAARHLALGVHAAHSAGDRPTAANLVSTLAYQVGQTSTTHTRLSCWPAAPLPAQNSPTGRSPLLTGVLKRYNERQTRECALYISWLSEAHVQAGDIEHAAALAERTLELSSSTSSSRGDDRVRLLAQRLEPHRAVGAVREFLDHQADRHRAR